MGVRRDDIERMTEAVYRDGFHDAYNLNPEDWDEVAGRMLAALDHAGAVGRVNAALRIVEDHRDARGNVQMGRGFASQVVELLRAAGGQ
jgi:uncharacterized protein (DUF1786 family)